MKAYVECRETTEQFCSHGGRQSCSSVAHCHMIGDRRERHKNGPVASGLRGQLYGYETLGKVAIQMGKAEGDKALPFEK